MTDLDSAAVTRLCECSHVPERSARVRFLPCTRDATWVITRLCECCDDPVWSAAVCRPCYEHLLADLGGKLPARPL